MKVSTYITIGWLAWSLGACTQSNLNELDLSGEWKMQLTSPDVTTVPETGFDQAVRLPGSLQEQGYGEDIGLQTKWTGQIVAPAGEYKGTLLVEPGQALRGRSLVSEAGAHTIWMGNTSGGLGTGARTLDDNPLC